MRLIHGQDRADLIQTQYPHPDITSGQHNNGPPTVWLRKPDGTLFNTRERSLHKVIRMWDAAGWKAFEDENRLA